MRGSKNQHRKYVCVLKRLDKYSKLVTIMDSIVNMKERGGLSIWSFTKKENINFDNE